MALSAIWSFIPKASGKSRRAACLRCPGPARSARSLRAWCFMGPRKCHSIHLGRILIPDHLREYAELRDQAKVFGSNEAIEVWSPELYDASLARDLEALPGILKRMSDQGSL